MRVTIEGHADSRGTNEYNLALGERSGNADTGETPGYVSLDGDTYIGLPATGFWAVNVINQNATVGKIANYSAFFKHRGSRDVTPSGATATN